MHNDVLRCALIGAGTRWTRGYHPWVCKNTHSIDIVAVAEPIRERREFQQNAYKLSDDLCFQDWQTMLSRIQGKNIDAVIICSSDSQHYEPVIACLQRGYDILLEKPMAQTVQECIDIVKTAEANNCKVLLAHVLRYTPFFMKIRDLILSGAIGIVQSIAHAEHVGYFHMAHSFVRGNWRRTDESNPIILAKSCHDLDMLLYILGDDVKVSNVASFGALRHFTKQNAPKGAPHMCSDACPAYNNCPYSIHTYLNAHNYVPLYDPHVTLSKENLAKLMSVSPHGRCVYHCDNDVCDSMSTIIEFDNGIHATFSLSGFTDEETRTIHVMGSQGQIVGDMRKDELHLMRFGVGQGPCKNKAMTTYHPHKDASIADASDYSGHGGGDTRFMKDFIKSVKGEGLMLTDSMRSLQSHVIGFAIEEARLQRKIVCIDEFMSCYNA